MKWTALTFGIVFLALTSCVQKPTKVSVKQDPIVKEQEDLPVFSGLKVPLGKTTVILDTRSFFDHASAHLFGSIRVDPSQFQFSSTWSQTQLKKKTEEWARYFARIGISKSSPVLVVGQGAQSSMDEARVALLLYALGVQQVGYRPIQYVKWPMSTAESQPLESSPYWDPQTKSSLFVLNAELEGHKAKGGMFGSAEPKLNPEAVVIDLRKESEYLKSPKLFSANVQTINIPMEQLYDSKGLPVDGIRKRLEALGYSARTRYWLASADFSRSSAGVLAFHALGLVRAAVMVPDNQSVGSRKN